MAKQIEECDGYKSLLAAVDKDIDPDRDRQFHDYRGKFDWVIARAKHYADKTGLDAADILDTWEKHRRYWYMNYYQDANQPEIKGDRVRVFDTTDALLASIGDQGFRCPMCAGVSESPYECSVAPCDWKVYGLFGHLGKGIYVFVKEHVRGESMFMPVAWEHAETPAVA